MFLASVCSLHTVVLEYASVKKQIFKVVLCAVQPQKKRKTLKHMTLKYIAWYLDKIIFVFYSVNY